MKISGKRNNKPCLKNKEVWRRSQLEFPPRGVSLFLNAKGSFGLSSLSLSHLLPSCSAELPFPSYLQTVCQRLPSPSLLINNFCDQIRGHAPSPLLVGEDRAGRKPVVLHQEDRVLVISLPENWLSDLLQVTMSQFPPLRNGDTTIYLTWLRVTVVRQHRATFKM